SKVLLCYGGVVGKMMGVVYEVVGWSRKWGRGVELFGGKNGLGATVASLNRGKET
nr:hypothetical protein [Tanacetum cinerariifolium]